MPLKIIRNDISQVKADAIVNTAGYYPVTGSGVDSRINYKAGEELLEARKKIGIIPYGKASITKAYNLNAKYVIHAVSPHYGEEHNQSVKLLENCYKESLSLAKEYKCSSIAFPLLASGNMGFPKGTALETAVKEIGRFLIENEMTVYLVVFDKESFSLSGKLFSGVKSYIDENFVDETSEDEILCSNILRSAEYDLCSKAMMAPCESSERSLDDLLDQMDETFTECLLRHIKEKNLKVPDVYKRANMDRKLFSKIKNNPDYQPSKTTAESLAIALKLNLDETKDFLGKAGYALTHSSKADIIIEYFINNGNYNIFEINEVLFAFDQNLLGF